MRSNSAVARGVEASVREDRGHQVASFSASQALPRGAGRFSRAAKASLANSARALFDELADAACLQAPARA